MIFTKIHGKFVNRFCIFQYRFKEGEKMADIRISSPINGKLIPLNEVNDPVFAGCAMGRGAAIKDPEGKVTLLA